MRLTIKVTTDEVRTDGLDDILAEMGFYDIEITEED